MSYDATLDRRCRRVAATLGLSFASLRDGRYRVGEEETATVAAAWNRLEAIGAQRRSAMIVEMDDFPRGKYDLDVGDAETVLRRLPAQSVQAVLTSPPYYRALNYDHPKQIGQEDLPKQYVARLMRAFEAARPVLRDDGVMWLLVAGGYVSNPSTTKIPRALQGNGGGSYKVPAQHHTDRRRGTPNHGSRLARAGYPLKTQLDTPGMLAAALTRAGWIVRSTIVWEKTSSVPDVATDRPGRNHETLLLVAKSARYRYYPQEGEASRSVWRFPQGRSRSGHPAPMPLAMARRCVKLSTLPGDLVLDPFAGSGTSGLAAIEAGRDARLIELNTSYAEIIRRKLG